MDLSLREAHILTLLIIFTLGFLIYKFLTRNWNHWKEFGIPYEKPSLLFGNFYDGLMLKRNLGEIVKDLYFKTNAPLYGFFIMNKPVLLVKDLDIIKHILVKDFHHFENRTVHYSKHDRWLSDSLFFIKSPKWKLIRSQMRSAFSSGKLKGLMELMNENAEETIKYITNELTNNKEIHMRNTGFSYATNIILNWVFGVNTNMFQEEHSTIRHYAGQLNNSSFSRGISAVLYFCSGFLVEIFGLSIVDPESTNFLGNLFLKSLKERKATNVARNDFIDTVLQMKSKEGLSITEENVLAAQALLLFLAGTETISSTLSWALYELCLHPDIQTKLRENILYNIKEFDGFTYEAIKKMDYLEKVVLEAFRRYAGLPFLDRECVRDYEIPGSNFIIKKGTWIYISLAGLHFDPKYYPNPKVFDPERFSKENRADIPKYAYMPFGEGPRVCIAARMGDLMVKVALAQIISKFEVVPCEKTPVSPEYQPGAFNLKAVGGPPMTFRTFETVKM